MVIREVRPTNLYSSHRYQVKEVLLKGNLTREQIRKELQGYVDELQERGLEGRVLVTMKYPEGWRSAKATRIGERIKLFTLSDSVEIDDPEYYPAVSMFIIKDPPREGGCSSKMNDCLYEVLKNVILFEMKKVWKTPEELKKFLDLERSDKIDIEDIPKIEEQLKNVKINVRGDHTYISTKKARYEVNLKLVDGHYSLDTDKMWYEHRVANTSRQPLIYQRYKDGNWIVYDGKTKMKIPNEEYNWHKTHVDSTKGPSSEYVLVNMDKKEGKTMEQTYEDFVRIADALYKETDGKIDMYKTGTWKKTAFELFRQLTPHIQPDPILQEEAEWLEDATIGPIIWAKNGYKGPAHYSDIVSMYSAIMKQQHFSIPVRKGEFKKMTQEEFNSREYLEYGIYRVKISGINKKLFIENKRNKYTHYDLMVAKENGYKMELICDENPNALVYDANCRVNGNEMFGKYVDYLFDLKKKGIEGTKKLLNCIWGGMIKKNELFLTVKDGEKTVIREGNEISSINKLNDKTLEVKYVKKRRIYDNNFARIGPFILAFARRLISNIIKPHLDKVVRVHTDGIFTTEKLEFNHKGRAMYCVKYGNDIGNMKYEGYCDYIHIIHCNKIVTKDGISVFDRTQFEWKK